MTPHGTTTARVPTLLYVEDEENDVLFMRRALDRAGVKVDLRTACDGDAAVAYFAAKPPRADNPLPDLVLLDLNLPARSGFDVLEWIRGQPDLRAIPVVVFSSSARVEDRERARLLGADDYMVKPAAPLHLVETVGDLWRRWLASDCRNDADDAPGEES